MLFGFRTTIYEVANKRMPLLCCSPILFPNICNHARFSRVWAFTILFCIGFQRTVLVKLDMMLENQKEALSLLRKLVGASKASAGGELLEDVINKQMDSPNDLKSVCDKLVDTFKAKMVNRDLRLKIVISIRFTYVYLAFCSLSRSKSCLL